MHMKRMIPVLAVLVSTAALAQSAWESTPYKDAITQREGVVHGLSAKTQGNFLHYECEGTKLITAYVRLAIPVSVEWTRSSSGSLGFRAAFDGVPSKQSWRVSTDYRDLIIPKNKVQQVMNAHTLAIRYRDLYDSDTTIEFENSGTINPADKPCQ